MTKKQIDAKVLELVEKFMCIRKKLAAVDREVFEFEQELSSLATVEHK